MQTNRLFSMIVNRKGLLLKRKTFLIFVNTHLWFYMTNDPCLNKDLKLLFIFIHLLCNMCVVFSLKVGLQSELILGMHISVEKTLKHFPSKVCGLLFGLLLKYCEQIWVLLFSANADFFNLKCLQNMFCSFVFYSKRM